MAVNLLTFPEFDLQQRDTVPVCFEKYVKRLDNMFTAMNITRASQKKAMLLHYVGEETSDVFETLTVPEPPEGSDEYKTAVKALADHFEPQKCVDYHVYVFRQETQKSGENIIESLHTSPAVSTQVSICRSRTGNEAADYSRNLIASPET